MKPNDVLNPSEGVAIFTDGSSSHLDRTGGWAWVALDAFEGIHANSGAVSDTTNNRMELEAVIQGLTTVWTLFDPEQVLVYSDSEYVVMGSIDRTRKRNKNRDLWKRLDEAVDRLPHVQFEHVKGHSGQEWNELADDLAGKARKRGC
jgi:ribonuclease HI